MTYFRFYFLVSIFVVFLQIIDGVALVSSSNIGAISLLISALSSLWVIFSVIAFFKVVSPKFIPATYTAYYMLSWAYGFYLASNMKNIEEFVTPIEFEIFYLCFGIYFTIASYVALNSYRDKNA
jgi:hypothetical protein